MDVQKMDEMKVKSQVKMKKMTAKFKNNYHKPRRLLELNRALRNEKMKAEQARILAASSQSAASQQPGPEQQPLPAETNQPAPAVPGNELGA